MQKPTKNLQKTYKKPIENHKKNAAFLPRKKNNINIIKTNQILCYLKSKKRLPISRKSIAGFIFFSPRIVHIFLSNSDKFAILKNFFVREFSK